MGNRIFDREQYARTARAVAAEGVVMLRNEGAVLPLGEKEKIALFGRGQFHYYKSGTGSGGMVNTSYVTGIREALENSSFVLNQKLKAVYEEWLKDNPFDAGAGWAGEPWFQKEMPLTEEVVAEAGKESDTAVIVLARTAGEDQDNKAQEGSFLLTKDEEEMLRLVCGAFVRTVVLLNVGNIIDMKWVKRYEPSAVLYVWQGGQEGGNGVLDVLSFDLNEILLETEQGMMMVKGTDLHVNRLSVEKGEVDLAGNIDSVAYSDVHGQGKQQDNLLSKLFR